MQSSLEEDSKKLCSLSFYFVFLCGQCFRENRQKKMAIWQLDCELDDLTAGSVTDDTNQKNLRGPRSASKSLHHIHLFLTHHNSLAALRSHGAEQLDLVAVKSQHGFSFPLASGHKRGSWDHNQGALFFQFQEPVNYSQMKGDQIVFPEASSSNEQPAGLVRIHQYLLSTQPACDDFV